MEADLIVAADGVNSVVQRTLFPEHPGAVYSGFTAWRMMVAASAVEYLPGETWGVGLAFGIAPMADGRVYAYAADRDEPGRVFDDGKAALRLPRGTDMQRRSHRLGDLSQSLSRPKIAVQNFGMRVAGRIAPDLALRAVEPVLGWQPPQL